MLLAGLVAGTSSGEIRVFTHQRGENLALTRRIEGHGGTDGFITDIAVFGDCFVTTSRNKEARVWSRTDSTEIKTVTHENRTACEAVKESYIILGCYEGMIHIHENTDGHAHATSVDMSFGGDHPGEWDYFRKSRVIHGLYYYRRYSVRPIRFIRTICPPQACPGI